MVDYNIAIPQQQLYQAPDFTQNAMRMQQTQLQEMQMQALARENAEARNIQRLYAQPGFDQFSPEGIKQLGQAGGYKAGIAAANAARQIENLQRQTAATNAGLEKTYLDIGAAQYDIAQNRLAAIPPGDAKGYAEWERVHGAAYRANGVNIPTPEQWAQDPTGKLQGHMVATSQSVRESMKPKAPVYIKGPGDTNLRVDPDNPDLLRETNILEAGAPRPGAGGVSDRNGADPSFPYGTPLGPLAPGAADRVRRGQQYAPELMQDATQPPARVVNALAAGQPQPPAVVGNAMAAPVAAASPYGELVQPPAARAPGVVGSREFAQRAKDAEMVQAIKKAGLETAEREQAKLDVAIPEAARLKAIGKQNFSTSLANMATQIRELGQKGMLVKTGETDILNRAKAALSDVSPQVTTVLSPERGENVQAYENLRATLLTALMEVTGKTASQINSNEELKLNLKALSSPGQTVKTITDTLNNLSQQYGSGKKYKVEDFTGGVEQNPPSEVPKGRRSTAPAPKQNKPPLTYFDGK